MAPRGNITLSKAVIALPVRKPTPMYELRFRLESLPKTTNSIGRKHWAVKAKEARDWHSRVMAITAGRKPVKPLKYAAIICTRHSSICPDYDGLVSSFKHVIDGLITCGIIEDDSMNHIGMPTFFWEKASPKKGFIEVDVLEAVPPDLEFP